MIYYDGRIIKLGVLGESHGDRVSIEICGIQTETEIDLAELNLFMQRRHGDGSYISEFCSTKRREPDVIVFDKGVSYKTVSDGDKSSFSDKERKAVITGDKIKAHIENTDIITKDYDSINTKLRPGHADLGAYLKYGMNGLKPGGGAFSGRMTAGICVAGGIARQILASRGIEVTAYAESIGGIKIDSEYSGNSDTNDSLAEYIQKIKDKGDSLGGTVRCIIKGMPEGIGGEYFEGLESSLAYAMLGIPSVKGIDFGSGVQGSALTGSQNNDEYFVENKKIVTHKNDQGGISGGISTGMDICFRVYFKPIPSIRILQRTVDVSTMEEAEITVQGRHDICIVTRVLPVVESLASLVILDRIMEMQNGR